MVFTLTDMCHSPAQTLKTLFLPQLPNLRLRMITTAMDESGLEMTLTLVNRTANCPCCQQPGRRVHSAYARRLTDVPCGDQCVRLRLWVRFESLLSGRLVSRLIMGNIALTPTYTAHLDQLWAALPELALAHQLAADFRDRFSLRKLNQLDPWLQRAATCSLPEFHAFAERVTK